MRERHRHRWATRVTSARLLAAGWMLLAWLLAGVGPMGPGAIGNPAERDSLAALVVGTMCGHTGTTDPGDAPDRSDTCGACCVFPGGAVAPPSAWLAPAPEAPRPPNPVPVRLAPLPDPATFPTARGPPVSLI